MGKLLCFKVNKQQAQFILRIGYKHIFASNGYTHGSYALSMSSRWLYMSSEIPLISFSNSEYLSREFKLPETQDMVEAKFSDFLNRKHYD
jgi:hypothetical protein